MPHKLNSSASMPLSAAEVIASRETRAQQRARSVFLLYPAVFAATLCSTTIGLTRWCLHDAAAHPHQKISAAALLIGLFYLLVPVAIIRLLCFAGMLLSPQQKDAAAELLPGASVRRSPSSFLGSSSVTQCKRLGVVILTEAAALLAVWTWCLVRLWHAA